MAVETRFFPLYEYDDGAVKVRKPGKKKPVEAYLKAQGRFSQMSTSEIEEYQKYVDMEFEELLHREELGKTQKKN